MANATYEVVALAARYWFILLILYILFRIIENAIGEYRYTKLLKQEIGRRFFGSLDILSCDVEGFAGHRFGIRRENVIGRSKRCEIRVPSPTMEASSGVLIVRGSKLMLVDMSAKHNLQLNGDSVVKQAQLHHGDEIVIGETTFYVNLEGRPETGEKKGIRNKFKRGGEDE